MQLLFFRPAYLHQGAYLNGSLSDRYRTAQKRGFLQGARCDDAEAALAHIVNKTGNCAASPLGGYFGQGRNGYLKILREPCLLAPIAFGSCLHAKLSLREVNRKYILQMA
jgi:hypothetical protein